MLIRVFYVGWHYHVAKIGTDIFSSTFQLVKHNFVQPLVTSLQNVYFVSGQIQYFLSRYINVLVNNFYSCRD